MCEVLGGQYVFLQCTAHHMGRYSSQMSAAMMMGNPGGGLPHDVSRGNGWTAMLEGFDKMCVKREGPREVVTCYVKGHYQEV